GLLSVGNGNVPEDTGDFARDEVRSARPLLRGFRTRSRKPARERGLVRGSCRPAARPSTFGTGVVLRTERKGSGEDGWFVTSFPNPCSCTSDQGRACPNCSLAQRRRVLPAYRFSPRPQS